MYFTRYLLPTLLASAFTGVTAAPVPRGESSVIDERGSGHKLTGKTGQLSRRSDLDPASVEVSSMEKRHPAGKMIIEQ